MFWRGSQAAAGGAGQGRGRQRRRRAGTGTGTASDLSKARPAPTCSSCGWPSRRWADAWGEVGSALINRLGKAAPDTPFSPDRFVTAWGNMSGAAKREVIFRSAGGGAQRSVHRFQPRQGTHHQVWQPGRNSARNDRQHPSVGIRRRRFVCRAGIYDQRHCRYPACGRGDVTPRHRAGGNRR